MTCTDSATPIAASGTSGITLNVNVANNAGTPLSNTATVACSCTESNTNNNTSNTDTVTVVAAQLPDLTISKMHVGNFTQGQTGAAYTITVTNSGAGPTSGTVTVSDALPSGLMATAISGTGWTCTQPSGTCTRSDVLAANASYPAITLMVNVAANASSPQTNMATVSGGGETNTANDTASDSTTINTAGTPALGGTLTGKTGVQNARVWSFSITNTGTGSALGAQATSFNLTQTSGAACTPVITSPTFPASLGDIAPAGSATLNVTIDFTGCVNLAKFTLSMPLTANNGAATGSVVRLNEYR